MMRTVLLLCIALELLFGKGVEWKTWNDALVLSKKNHKIIMIEAVRNGCHYCEDMQKNVFNNSAMGNLIQKRFIPVKIKIDQQDLPLGLDVSMTPTFFFISEDKQIIRTVPGAWNQEDFKSMLEEVK